VQGQARVVTFDQQPGFATLRAAFPPGSVAGVALGGSVAVNGTCLTVTGQPAADELTFDLISETLRATNLGTLRVGSAVNFERSARLGDEVGGHHVSGHVHATALLSELEDTENNRRLTFTVPERLTQYILPKVSVLLCSYLGAHSPLQGFIAVDGCSLTVGPVTSNTFQVWLIPETLRVTTFGERKVGDSVNLELDAQTVATVDTVLRFLEAREAANSGA